MHNDPRFECIEHYVINDPRESSKLVGYKIGVRSSMISRIPDHYISPIFTILDHDLSKCYIECGGGVSDEDDLCDCKFEAISWLEDFLIRLSGGPHVMHCTSDGEIFTK